MLRGGRSGRPSPPNRWGTVGRLGDSMGSKGHQAQAGWRDGRSRPPSMLQGRCAGLRQPQPTKASRHTAASCAAAYGATRSGKTGMAQKLRKSHVHCRSCSLGSWRSYVASASRPRHGRTLACRWECQVRRSHTAARGWLPRQRPRIVAAGVGRVWHQLGTDATQACACHRRGQHDAASLAEIPKRRACSTASHAGASERRAAARGSVVSVESCSARTKRPYPELAVACLLQPGCARPGGWRQVRPRGRCLPTAVGQGSCSRVTSAVAPGAGEW